MPTVRQETYTTAQPDGTLVTTITKTKTRYVNDGSSFRIGRGPVTKGYIRKPSTIVRAAEVVRVLLLIPNSTLVMLVL